MKRILFLMIGLAIVIASCRMVSEEPVDAVNIRLPMGYIPDPQYAPYYVAVEKGYYADEGIEIEFDYSFETDGIALVGANEL
ncbi:MAG: ABC transporter substrate-binding protein, partial [Chloroflexi bacterium]|nr:ABC transporter substrate-binding protein [Chloroflexota bacterium]